MEVATNPRQDEDSENQPAKTLDCNPKDLASLLELWSPVIALVSTQNLQLAEVKVTSFYSLLPCPS